jgi:tRNA U38,U39,U40 pseudouridine synthase TruA
MVRNIVGALIEAGKGNLGEREIRALLEPEPDVRFATAPAKGLFLIGVEYAD